MCEFFITLYKQHHPWRSVAPFLSFCFKNKQERRMRRRGRWRLPDRNPLSVTSWHTSHEWWRGLIRCRPAADVCWSSEWERLRSFRGVCVCVCLSDGCWCVSSWLLRAEQHEPAAVSELLNLLVCWRPSGLTLSAWCYTSSISWNFSTVLVASNLFQMQKRYIFHFQIHWRCFLRVSSRWWCASVHMRFGSLVYVHLEPCVSTWFLELNTVHYERLFFWHSFQLLESLMICIRCHKTCAMLVDYNRDENHHLIRPVCHPTVGPDWLCGHALLFP